MKGRFSINSGSSGKTMVNSAKNAFIKANPLKMFGISLGAALVLIAVMIGIVAITCKYSIKDNKESAASAQYHK